MNLEEYNYIRRQIRRGSILELVLLISFALVCFILGLGVIAKDCGWI